MRQLTDSDCLRVLNHAVAVEYVLLHHINARMDGEIWLEMAGGWAGEWMWKEGPYKITENFLGCLGNDR